MNIQDRFYDSFSQMIYITEKQRDERFSVNRLQYSYSFVNEYCVLEMSVPRQVGKTKFITDKAKIYNSLVIYEKHQHRPEGTGIYSMEIGELMYIRGNLKRKYKYVFLDEVSYNKLCDEYKVAICQMIDPEFGLIISLHTGQ